MHASGWNVINVVDGSYDIAQIVEALDRARVSSGKPTFINIRTIIGQDMASAGTYKAHHGPFDWDSIRALKKLAGIEPESKYRIPARTLELFRKQRAKGQQHQDQWLETVAAYKTEHPELAAEFDDRVAGRPADVSGLLSQTNGSELEGLATREANGIILQKLWHVDPSLCGGGADLINSNKFTYDQDDVFQPPSGYQGRYIRHGIREHAMAGIANGLAVIPITATFFMFYIYAAPAVRMGALSGLQVIHIATHDSFGEPILLLFISTTAIVR